VAMFVWWIACVYLVPLASFLSLSLRLLDTQVCVVSLRDFDILSESLFHVLKYEDTVFLGVLCLPNEN
jgi:hypothetical protein